MRADILYNKTGFRPLSRKADEWLWLCFSALGNDLSPGEVETIADMARAAGFVVRQSANSVWSNS